MNNSEEFRRECEARRVLKMADDKRQEFYQGVLKKRGQKALDELLNDVKKQRRLTKSPELAL